MLLAPALVAAVLLAAVLLAAVLLTFAGGGGTWARAESSDIPGPASVKPTPPKVYPAMPIPGTDLTFQLLGRFRLTRHGGETAVSTAGPLRARIDGAGAPILVRVADGETPVVTAATEPDGTTVLYIRLPAATVELGDRALSVEDLQARVMVGEKTTLRVTSLRLRPVGLAVWAPAVTVRATATLADAGLSVDGAATGADGLVNVTFAGSVPTGDGGGRLDLRLRPVAFAPGGLQPRDLIPVIGDAAGAVAGRVGGSASIRFTGGEPSTSGRLTIDDLSFTTEEVRAEGLNGTITLSSLWPPRTPPGQILTLDRLDPGMPASDGFARFQVDGRGRLRIESAGIGISGGRLFVEDVVLDPAADEHRFVVEARRLDLQQVLDTADVAGATMSGRVSGSIPVVLSADGVSVDDANLATDAPGVLRYAPALPPAPLQNEDERISLLRDALENLHYDRLSVGLSGRSGETWRSLVQIAGNNPDLLDGQPIVLNVDLSVEPGEASLELAGTRLDVGDALPLYNALFGVGFLEWLGDRLHGLKGPDG